MGIEEVADIIQRIAGGFEEACVKCLQENSGVIVDEIKEQLKSGLDGEEKHLSPTYDDDPYFEKKGIWHHRSEDYKNWKYLTTPPLSGTLVELPPRPYNVPNLFIDGTFYSEISAIRSDMGIVIDPGHGNGPEIVSKYGDSILGLGKTAIEFFNSACLIPAIDSFLKECGYK